MILRANDIVISTTRPHRGAIAIIREEDDGAIGSTGFVVLRKVKEVGYLRELLIEVLLTKVVLLQFQQRSSGGAYPAITLPELKQVLVPLPPQEEKEQERILEEIQRRRDEARRLRQEAEEKWEAAKSGFEAELLGEE